MARVWMRSPTRISRRSSSLHQCSGLAERGTAQETRTAPRFLCRWPRTPYALWSEGHRSLEHLVALRAPSKRSTHSRQEATLRIWSGSYTRRMKLFCHGPSAVPIRVYAVTDPVGAQHAVTYFMRSGRVHFNASAPLACVGHMVRHESTSSQRRQRRSMITLHSWAQRHKGCSLLACSYTALGEKQ